MKFYFTKPKKNKILIYDSHSLDFAKILFKKKPLSILNRRFESINLFVLFFTLYKNILSFNLNLRNIVNQYKINYIKFVSPAIIYTSIYNDLGFFKLKSFYPNAKYIADQNGLRDPDFFRQLKKNKRESILKIDHFFVFNKHDSNFLMKYIKANYHVLGKTDNNSYFKKVKLPNNNIKKILFISGKIENRSNYRLYEKKVFKNLISICEKKNIKLFFREKLIPLNSSINCMPIIKRKLFYQKFFGSKNWNFLPHEMGVTQSVKKKYEQLTKFNFVVQLDSTLGYELLSKGVKVVCVTDIFPITNLDVYFNKQKIGIFWTNKTDILSILNKINSVIKITFNKWKKISNKFSTEIVSFDKNNLGKISIIKKILIK